MMKSVEVMTGFEGTKKFGKQISKPKFKLLDPDNFTGKPGESLLCRLRTVDNKRFMIETPAGLNLPTQDEYFLISFGNKKTPKRSEMTDEQKVNRRLSAKSGFKGFALETMDSLLSNIKKSKKIDYKYTTTLFIKQPTATIKKEDKKSAPTQTMVSKTTTTIDTSGY
jgi:hypothetical protein